MMPFKQVISYIKLLVLFLHIVFYYSCEREYIINHTESDVRTLNRYIKQPVVRPDLELVNIFDSNYDFQLMNEDEWGFYFNILRVNRKSGMVEVAIQDSIHAFPRKYEVKQFLKRDSFVSIIDSLIREYEIWEIKDTLNKNRITDGGNLSILVKEDNKAKLITWQDYKRNESPDKQKVRSFYNEIWSHTENLLRNEYEKYIRGEKYK